MSARLAGVFPCAAFFFPDELEESFCGAFIVELRIRRVESCPPFGQVVGV